MRERTTPHRGRRRRRVFADNHPRASVAGGELELLERILAHPRLDVNARTPNGWTALHIAARNGHGPVVDLLLSHAQIDTRAKCGDGLSAAYMVRKSRTSPHPLPARL